MTPRGPRPTQGALASPHGAHGSSIISGGEIERATPPRRPRFSPAHHSRPAPRSAVITEPTLACITGPTLACASAGTQPQSQAQPSKVSIKTRIGSPPPHVEREPRCLPSPVQHRRTTRHRASLSPRRLALGQEGADALAPLRRLSLRAESSRSEGQQGIVAYSAVHLDRRRERCK